MKVMQIEVKQGRSDEEPLELLVLLHCEGDKQLKDEAASINKSLGGQLVAALDQGEFEGKPNELFLVHTQGKCAAKRVLLVGLGQKRELRLDSFRQAMGVAAKRVRQAKITSFGVAMPPALPRGAAPLDIAQAIAEGAILGAYQFTE